MFGISGPWEIAFVVALVVLLFGTRKLPELGSGLGKAISNFKKSYKDGTAIDVTPKEDEAEKGQEAKKSESKVT